MTDQGLQLSSSRRLRRKAEVHEKIYETAIALFRSQGFESVTVQDICDVADTAKQTFFNHFPGKDHILAEYHRRLVSDILQEISELPSSRHTEAILSAMRVFAAGVEKSESLSRTILRNVFSSDVLESNDRQNEQKIFRWFRDQILLAIRSGELVHEINPRLLTSVVMCILSSTVQEWIGSSTFDLEKELVLRTRFMLRLSAPLSAQRTGGRR